MENYLKKIETISFSLIFTLLIWFSVWDCSHEKIDYETYGQKNIEVFNYLEMCTSKCNDCIDSMALDEFLIEFNKAETKEDLDDLLEAAKIYFE